MMLKDVRCFFPKLFEPQLNPKYPSSGKAWTISVGVVPGSDDDKEIWKLIETAGSEKYKREWPDVKAGIFASKQNCCYHPGHRYKNADGSIRAGYEGLNILNLRRSALNKDGTQNAPPRVLSKAKDPVTGKARDITDSSIIYGGCYVNVKFDIFAFGAGQGIGGGLLAVQFERPGAAFGGGRPDADGFDTVDDTGSDDPFETEL